MIHLHKEVEVLNITITYEYASVIVYIKDFKVTDKSFESMTVELAEGNSISCSLTGAFVVFTV